MEKRQLGNTDLQVYPIAFGGNVFGWTINEKQSFEILDGFTEAGFNFIDTADVYSRWASGNVGGESEAIIGKWMKQKKNRQNLIITTKVGSDMGDGKSGLKKSYVLKAIEDSLRRLQTDYLDLYQTHFDDESTPVLETLEAYEQLIKEGKIRWIGTSNMTVERIDESLKTSKEHGIAKYETLQPYYNLYSREKYESNLESLVLENNLGVFTYYSLESGFLTGKYRSKKDLIKSARGARMENYFNDRGMKILDALDEVSKQYHTTLAAVALAWLIQKPSITAPIVSATNLSQLDSIIKAPQLNLDTNALNFLDSESAWK